MGIVRDLIEQDPPGTEGPLKPPESERWRAARIGETEAQRVDRVSRSCCYCGEEFSRVGAELDAHEDQH